MVPLLWEMTCTYLAIPQPLAVQWWRAVKYAHGPAAVDLKQKVLWASTDARVRIRTSTPQELVAVVESLVEEKRLPWPSAQTIIEKVLARTDKEGQWRAA
jgi:hypothetical protein